MTNKDFADAKVPATHRPARCRLDGCGGRTRWRRLPRGRRRSRRRRVSAGEGFAGQGTAARRQGDKHNALDRLGEHPNERAQSEGDAAGRGQGYQYLAVNRRQAPEHQPARLQGKTQAPGRAAPGPCPPLVPVRDGFAVLPTSSGHIQPLLRRVPRAGWRESWPRAVRHFVTEAVDRTSSFLR